MLSRKAALKRLEEPTVYITDQDELYEVNDEAFAFLSRCDGTMRGGDLTDDDGFVTFCLAEGILLTRPKPAGRRVVFAASPVPSLRYLELQLTSRCNLACLHCYQGDRTAIDLPLDTALRIAREFEAMAGLRLLISGGEPLLYPGLFDFLDETEDLALRKILITNGTLINVRNVRRLKADEIQFSLDGWERGHERIRGRGSFSKVMRGIEAALSAGIAVSAATMVHRGNLDEFDRMNAFIEKIGAVGWGIDLPCPTGRFDAHSGIVVSPQIAGPLMRYAFGGGNHATPGFACGHHLMTVLPTGGGVKCGFYADDILGDAAKSLGGCWRSMKHVRIDELECRGCLHLEECGGGCRFRAPGPLAPDPVMCAAFGVYR